MPAIKIYPLGEQAVTISFGNRLSEPTHRLILATEKKIRQQGIPGIIEFVPAYTTLTVYFDPDIVRQNNREVNSSPTGSMIQLLQHTLEEEIDPEEITPPGIMTLPVCYDSRLAPDLDFVSEFCRLSKDEIIGLHSSVNYTVYLLGFSPGFPYMGELPEKLNVPRKANPLDAVPAGSVGIAGKQTGIYPFESPAGWQVIGRTPVRLFNTKWEFPSLLKPGMRVRFEPVSLATYSAI